MEAWAHANNVRTKQKSPILTHSSGFSNFSEIEQGLCGDTPANNCRALTRPFSESSTVKHHLRKPQVTVLTIRSRGRLCTLQRHYYTFMYGVLTHTKFCLRIKFGLRSVCASASTGGTSQASMPALTPNIVYNRISYTACFGAACLFEEHMRSSQSQ